MKALTELATHAGKKNWGIIPRVDSTAPKPERRLVVPEGAMRLEAPIDKVRKILMKSLKPNRAVIDVVQFKDGRVEEVTAEEPEKKAASAPAKEPVKEPVKEPTKEPEKPVAGTSVAKPTQGCPEPRLARAELRAREVLNAFLDEDQRSDFEERNAFVSVGAETGHHYMVTSRHARDQLAQWRRQLYDLDEKMPYCVHDYSVPPAEEMLAIHLMLQFPEHERYLRHLE